ncbi:MAG TPA: dienelactone hydrolase family protein [Steroidobacteraceae bacterium]|jgi:carboxymethylenebutenolidase|nr:dienelactone hydrolase family protein [Steroidobacteraceae bacterium]
MSHLQLRATDGHTFQAYVAKPAGPGPARGAVVVVQEIFGVTGHIERVAERYAAEGYLAIAPALFDRQHRGVNLPYDDHGVKVGFEYAMKADTNALMADLTAAIDAVAHAGAVGMVGYCWGGRVVYMAGSRTNLAAGVVYYGGGITQVLEPTPRCPMLFHFGRHDTHIPLADVEKIRAAFPQGEYHVYDAGHGFNCTDRASFDAAAAHLALERTLAFFASHIG